MKKILIILVSVLLFSCSKTVEEGTFEVKTSVKKHHEDSGKEFGMHWGYSPAAQKRCYHIGVHTVPEENIVTFDFLGDTITRDSKELYNRIGDSITITYTEIYKIKKEEKTFRKNKILNIK